MASLGSNCPNFFIVGAPKCGTTSLASWLADHPNVYMPPVKEPHFFNTDLAYINTPNARQYRRLFSGVTKAHVAIGEASVFYLFSQVAIPRIENLVQDARYIVMVRNPCDMAPALHEQQVFAGNEHILDFGEAWRLSDERLRGVSVTRRCREPRLLAYSSVCRLGEQISRLYQNVARERVLVLVLDDLERDPNGEYRKVLSFLGLPHDDRAEFPVLNRAKDRRWRYLASAIRALNEASRKLRIPRLGTGLMAQLDLLNRKERARAVVPAGLLDELRAYFREDVKLLSTLLDRPLTTWVDSAQADHKCRAAHQSKFPNPA